LPDVASLRQFANPAAVKMELKAQIQLERC
jgi:hypothetical protein